MTKKHDKNVQALKTKYGKGAHTKVRNRFICGDIIDPLVVKNYFNK